MSKWGSTYVKGVLLCAEPASIFQPLSAPQAPSMRSKTKAKSVAISVPSVAQSSISSSLPAPITVDLAEETQKTLQFLSSLFGQDDDWGGEESLDSDIDKGMADEGVGTNDSVTYDVVPQEVVQKNTRSTAIEDPDHPPRTQPVTQLKDLFAPSESAGRTLILLSQQTSYHFSRLFPSHPPRP